MARTVVVGAGPAGAALAFLLARRGCEVTLVERQSDFAREFRGEALMPSGVDAIRQMGLREAFEALPQAQAERVDIYQQAERALTIPVARGGLGPRFVSQPALLEMLVTEAGRSERFRFERGASVSSLLRDGDDRVVGVHARTSRGEQELHADLVVYGRTDPEVNVYVDDVRVPVREDGTFDARFALSFPRSAQYRGPDRRE